MQAVSEGGASRVAQLVGGAGAGDRRRDAAGSPEAQEPRTPDRDESALTLLVEAALGRYQHRMGTLPENVRKSVSRVCCSPTAGARCQEAPLACRPHSLAPRECGRPTRPIRLDARALARLWSCHKLAAERATEGVPSEVMEFET